MNWHSLWGCRPIAGWLMACTLTTLALPAPAAERGEADTQVREALHREIYGLHREKRDMLREVIAQQPESRQAHWHLGYVKQGDQWIKPSRMADELENDPRMAGYYHRRSLADNTVADQLALADWCEKRGLQQREKAHLSRVIQLEPDHGLARQRLGFVRTGVDWIHRTEIEANRKRQQQQAADLAAWERDTIKLLKRLHSRSEQHRTQALADISQITRSDAIATLEMRIAPHSEAAASAATASLGNMTDPRAMQSLARIALFAPWQSTRVAAAGKLSNWPVEDFAPLLLSEMYLPLETNVVTATDSRGRLLYRHTFEREGQDERQQMVLDTAYQRDSRPRGSRDLSLFMAMLQMGGQVADMELAAMRQDAFTTEMNRRIADCLNVATDQTMPPNPNWWWDWWNEYNEVFTSGEKQVKVAYRSNEVIVSDPVISSGSSTPRGDCLVAGTLVWTESGLKAIESIQVGDLVLSQEVNTGELAYQPVLNTTIRPAGPLVQLKVGDETIRSSGGHLLWVTGEGWMKTREIASGVELHGLQSTLPVAATEELPAEQTYNLVVEGFHTYFITKQRLLSHDNTVRSPTQAVVPGLVP